MYFSEYNCNKFELIILTMHRMDIFFLLSLWNALLLQVYKNILPYIEKQNIFLNIRFFQHDLNTSSILYQILTLGLGYTLLIFYVTARESTCTNIITHNNQVTCFFLMIFLFMYDIYHFHINIIIESNLSILYYYNILYSVWLL